MQSMSVTGNVPAGILPEAINGCSVETVATDAACGAAAPACVVVYPTATAELLDIMAARSFFEELKNADKATVMAVSIGCAGDAPNWLMYFGMVLPYVDYFCADYADALAMLEPNLLEDEKDTADPELCDQMALSLLNMGCAAVLFDLGEKGVYLRTSSVGPRFEQCGPSQPENIDQWWAREMYIPAQNAAAPLAFKTAALVPALLGKGAPESALEAFAAAAEGSASETFSAYSGWNAAGKVLLGPMDGKEA